MERLTDKLTLSNPVLVKAATGLLLASAILLYGLVLSHTSGAKFDMRSFYLEGRSVLDGRNIYAATNRFPRVPVWLYVPALCELVSGVTHISFDTLVRVPACLGDLGLAIALAKYGVKQFQWTWKALSFPTLFVLNPLPLLVSVGHGQYDSVVVLLMFLAMWWSREHRWVSVVTLGLGIALKGFPVLLLPILVFRWRKRMWPAVVAVAAVPTVVAAGVYALLFGWNGRMVTDVLGYGGVRELGWSASIGRAVVAYRLSELVFVLLVLLVAYRLRADSALFVATAVLMGFYAMGVDLSVQYLVWALPFLVVANPIWTTAYSLSGISAALAFYAVWFPGAVPVPAAWPHGLSVDVYVLVVALPSLVSALFIIRLLDRARTSAVGPWYRLWS